MTSRKIVRSDRSAYLSPAILDQLKSNRKLVWGSLKKGLFIASGAYAMR